MADSNFQLLKWIQFSLTNVVPYTNEQMHNKQPFSVSGSDSQKTPTPPADIHFVFFQMWMSVRTQVCVEPHDVRIRRAAMIACVISDMSTTTKPKVVLVSVYTNKHT